MKEKLIAIIQIFLPLILGSIVGIIISGHIDYSNLNLPPFAPPKILFPIAWTIIYLLMGLSYYLFSKKNPDATKEKIIYFINLIVNLLWSIIFFLWKLRFFAVIWIVLLDLIVILLIYLFYQKNKISSYLLIPYFLWILFATYLTIGIYFLN